MKMLTPEKCADALLVATPRLLTLSETKLKERIEEHEPLVSMLHPHVQSEYLDMVLTCLNSDKSISA